MAARRNPGPKPDPNVIRTKSGRPSKSRAAQALRARDMIDQVTRMRGAEARQGLTLEQARRPEASTALGRLWLRGRIAQLHLDAGELIRNRILDARRAIGIHVVTDRPEGITPASGFDPSGATPGYSRWAQSAIRRRDEVHQIIAEELGERRGARAWQAVALVIDGDTEDVVIDDLRAALAAVRERLILGNKD